MNKFKLGDIIYDARPDYSTFWICIDYTGYHIKHIQRGSLSIDHFSNSTIIHSDRLATEEDIKSLLNGRDWTPEIKELRKKLINVADFYE